MDGMVDMTSCAYETNCWLVHQKGRENTPRHICRLMVARDTSFGFQETRERQRRHGMGSWDGVGRRRWNYYDEGCLLLVL